MAALSDTRPTYLDWAKRRDPDGGMATIMEIMSKATPIVEDMVVLEANGPLHHRTTVRSGLPSGTWRKLNYGVPVEKGKTKQVNDVIGSLETYAEVDKMIADLNGNTAEWRMSEERGFMEGLAQTIATAVIEGNTDTDPEKFMGFAPRYNSLGADNGRMIVQGTGSSGADTNSSIWGIVWDSNASHGLFPKGMSGSAGLKVQDLGQETLLDGNTPTGYYEGYRTHYQWMAGLSVRDWRKACRVHTNVADVVTGTINILDLMADAYNNLHMPNSGKLCWYTTREMKTILDIEAMNKTNMALAQQQQDNGGPVTTFWGAPVKHLETMVTWTEARIPA